MPSGTAACVICKRSLPLERRGCSKGWADEGGLVGLYPYRSINGFLFLLALASKANLSSSLKTSFRLFLLQDLLLGDHCCIDILGATQFRTPRANWDKRCCSNPKGPVVPIPQDLSVEDAKKIDKQIARMGQGNLKEVMIKNTLAHWVNTKQRG